MVMEATSRLIYELTHDLILCWRLGAGKQGGDHMHGGRLILVIYSVSILFHFLHDPTSPALFEDRN